MSDRDRASGWKHAKISGHDNEDLIRNLLKNDKDYQKIILSKINRSKDELIDVVGGGIKDKKVPCIFQGEKTTSKTDISLIFKNSSSVNISLKKSSGGQVYLIEDRRFLYGFESHFNKIVSNNVKRAIELFFGSSNDMNKLISNYGTYTLYEKRKSRLVAESLMNYDPILYHELIHFLMTIYQKLLKCVSQKDYPCILKIGQITYGISIKSAKTILMICLVLRILKIE